MFNLFRKQEIIPGRPKLKPCPFYVETPVIEHSRLNEMKMVKSND